MKKLEQMYSMNVFSYVHTSTSSSFSKLDQIVVAYRHSSSKTIWKSEHINIKTAQIIQLATCTVNTDKHTGDAQTPSVQLHREPHIKEIVLFKTFKLNLLLWLLYHALNTESSNQSNKHVRMKGWRGTFGGVKLVQKELAKLELK